MDTTQDLTVTSILSLFETDKVQRQSFVASVVESLKEGNVSPLKIHLQVKAMGDIIFQLTSTDEKKNKSAAFAKEYMEMLMIEASKHGKAFELYNAKFETKEVGAKYDYTVCKDPIINSLKEQEDKLKERIKEREKFLQNIPEGGHTVLDEDSGEVSTIYRPAKSSTTSIAVTLK